MDEFKPEFTCQRTVLQEHCDFNDNMRPAALLHAVQQLHSLRAAALSMDMAYSKAWTIIKNSEKALGFPLLTSTTGGKGGGGQSGSAGDQQPTPRAAQNARSRSAVPSPRKPKR